MAGLPSKAQARLRCNPELSYVAVIFKHRRSVRAVDKA